MTRWFSWTVLLLALLVVASSGSVAQEAAPASPPAPAARDLLKVDLTPVKDTPALHKRALVVGIGAYVSVPPLKAPPVDAVRFADFLVKSWGFPQENVVLMTDDTQNPNLRPTSANLMEQMELLVKGTTPQSEIVVFFSGHGLARNGTDYLLPSDGRPARVQQTCVSLTEFGDSLAAKRPRRALLFLDGSRDSGEVRAATGPDFGAGFRSTAAQICALFSCSRGELSRDSRPPLSGGVFTRFLLEGLGGAGDAATPDGVITFDSLSQYVRAKVFSYVQKEYTAAQSPVGSASPVVLARYDGRPAAPGGERDLLRVPVKDAAGISKRALVIGVAAYTRAARLSFTLNDARGFRDFLSRSWGFRDDNILLMTDDQPSPTLVPTFVNLLEQTDLLVKGITRDSQIVLFFSGSGVRFRGKDYLVPLDGRPNAIDRTCLCLTDLLDAIAAKNPQRALVFIDACRDSGEGKASPEGIGSPTPAPSSPGLAYLSSCEPGQKSFESKPPIQNGVFTRYLLEGLGGAKEAADPDGVVTFDTLTQYVRGKVFAYVHKEFGTQQSPLGLSSFGRMALSRAFTASPPLADTRLAVAGLVSDAYRQLFTGRMVQAFDAAREVLKLDPDSGDAHYILGRVYLANNQLDDALRELSLAKKLQPDLPGLTEKLSEVAQLKAKADGRSDTTIDSILRDAETRLVEKNYRAAEVLAQVVLFATETATHPEKAQALSVLGRVFEANGEATKALKAFQDAVQLQPDQKAAGEGLQRLKKLSAGIDVAAKVNEALQLLSQGKLLEAELRAREVLAAEPNNARATYVLGRVSYSLNRFDDAILSYRRAVEADPTLADARTGLSDALARLAERRVLTTAREADTALHGGSRTEAEAKARQVLASNTKLVAANALARYVLGRVAEAQGKHAEALAHYQDALQIEPGREEARQGLERVIKAIGQADVNRLIEDAAHAREEGKLAVAEAAARQAVARAPENARAHFVLGQVFASAGHPEESTRELLEARRLDPNLAGLAEALAGAQGSTSKSEASRIASEAHRNFLLAEWPEAVTKARRAVELDPANALAHAVLGAALLSLNDEKGLAAIDAAERLDGRLPLVQTGRGIAYYQQFIRLQKGPPQQWMRSPTSPELIEQAISSFKAAIGLDGAEIEALNNLGSAYQLQASILQYQGKIQDGRSRYAGAIAAYRRAIKVNDALPVPHYNLANALLSTGAFAEAESAYRRAIELYDKNPRFHAGLASALWLQKKREEAVAEAKRAIAEGWKDDWVYDQMEQAGIKLR